MEYFTLEKYGAMAASLFQDARETLLASQSSDVKALSYSVPTSMIDEDIPLSIAFAGQYSAGKSTILSILTGEKLKTGGGITTGSVQALDWHGITVYDTPGIHTQKRPDHDEITYEAIAKADLLVFCVTNEGFSDHLGKHFRNLLINKGKGNEMMLVVNKMEDAAGGNTPDAQAVYIEKNLLPVISPEFTPQQLYTTFVDANAYNEALDETDEEEKQWLLGLSGFEQLILNLNKFVKDKQLLGRCTSNLYKLEQILTEALSHYHSGDEDIDLTRQYLSRQRRILVESRDRIKEKSYSLIRTQTNAIKRWGNETANQLTSKDSEDDVNKRLEDKFKEVNAVPETAIKLFAELLNEESSRIEENIDDLNTSHFGKMVFESIRTHIKSTSISPETASKINSIASKTTELGKVLSKWASGPNVVSGWSNIGKLGNFSGSQAHNAVLQIGHFFGKKFAPWEAVKWAKGIGVAGKVLGVAGAAVGVFIQISNDKAENNIEKQLQAGRAEIRACFDEVADVIDMKFDEETGIWIEENLDPKIKEIDTKIIDLEDLVNINDSEYKSLNELLLRTKKLISEIQNPK